MTTLSVTDALDNGDLYFAFSQTSDPTGKWNFYKFVDVCSGTQNGQFPYPDQPIVGYNQNWLAVDLQCFGKGGHGGAGSDQLLLLANSVLSQNPAPSPLPATALTPPFFGARPSRDISGGAGQNLFLVGSVAPASGTPYVQVTSVNASGNFAGPGLGGQIVQSPGNGVAGTFGNIAPAQHDSCGAGSACAVSLQDARIANVILQKGNDGHVYLLTSFHAADTANGTAQALWFIGQADTFSGFSQQWNTIYVDGPAFWAAYPTITMDSQVGAAFTFQSFYLNSNIYPNWYISSGFVTNNQKNPPLVGYGILPNAYRGAYAGCAGSSPTRWGDYMSTVWDPNLPAPATSNGFWTVQEYANGGGAQTGSNQSTQITELVDPLPYFVGFSGGEAECNVTIGQDCVIKLSAPSNLQNGDVVVAALDMGGNFAKPPDPPDSTWVTLPIANMSGAKYMMQGSCASYDLATDYAYLHVYGKSSETGTYKFKHVVETYCNGNARPEIEGKLYGYRLANNNLNQYLLYGYPALFGTTVSVGPAPSSTPGPGTLLNIFYGSGLEVPESGEPAVGFGPPINGTPTATAETPFQPAEPAYLLADVPLAQTGTAIGYYSVGVSQSGFATFGWQLFVPQ